LIPPPSRDSITGVEGLERLLILLAAAALVVWAYFKARPCNLRIVVRRGVVDVQGRALTGKRTEVVTFFEQDMPELARVRVEGYWDGRYLRLRFRGRLTPGQRQRIRNFLLVTL